MSKFDPNAAAADDAGIFGLPYSKTDARLILIPVPWEATTSYGGGTSKGPAAILEASHQVDLYDLEFGNAWEAGIHMLSEPSKIKSLNKKAKALAQQVIKRGGVEGAKSKAEAKKLLKACDQVNDASRKLNDWVFETTVDLLDSGKIVGLVGGDHASPFGSIQALAEKHPGLGVLHVDAHADLRKAYEGFTYSHASIMYNVLEEISGVAKLVQVGIRDFCQQEMDVIQAQKNRVKVFFDRELSNRQFEGEAWMKTCKEIIQELPNQVYISFDIDGLDPILCPSTGTPVPGGLSFNQAVALIKAVAESGRQIVGFDLNEVAPSKDGSEWDANVGARLLYKLCGWTLVSQGGSKK